VGKYVMMLSKHSDEGVANKRRCQALIEKWMRPVYKKSSEYTQQAVRVASARDTASRARAALPLPSAAGAGAGGSGDILERAVELKPGDAGFRYHATIPQALAMDFKVMPQSSAMPLSSKKYDKESAKGKLTSKFLNLKRKSGKKTQAEQLSVEGRKL
jgi:transcription factor SPN1